MFSVPLNSRGTRRRIQVRKMTRRTMINSGMLLSYIQQKRNILYKYDNQFLHLEGHDLGHGMTMDGNMP